MKLTIKFIVGMLFGMVSFIHSAQAFTAQGTLNISATFVPSCTLATNNINLGSIVSSASTATGNVLIEVQCDSGVAYNVTIDAGLNPLGSFRQLKNATNTSSMVYNIFNGAVAWGDTGYSNTIFGNPRAGTGTGSVQNLTATVVAYPSSASSNLTGLNAAHSDTVTITLHY